LAHSLNIANKLNHQIKRGKGRPPKRTDFTISRDPNEVGDGTNQINPIEHELVSR